MALPPINEVIRDRAVQHAIRLERLKTQESRTLTRYIDNELMPPIIDRFGRRLAALAARVGLDPSRKTTRAIQKLMRQTEEEVQSAIREVYRESRATLERLSQSEAEWQLSVLRSTIPVTVALNDPSGASLRRVVADTPIAGRLLRDWFDDISDSTLRRIETQINVGRTLGEDPNKIIRRVAGVGRGLGGGGVWNNLSEWAEGVTRTSITHTSVYAREAVYAANTDLVKGVMMVATLDNRTTLICINQDGKVYP